jgi:hypothetical protein
MGRLTTNVRHLKHRGWGWVVTILLVVVATYPANTIRAVSLIAAWIVGTITFHRTKFSAKSTPTTIRASIIMLVIFASVFWLSYKPDELHDSGILRRPSHTILSSHTDVIPVLEIGDSGVFMTPNPAPGTAYDLNSLKPFLDGSEFTIGTVAGWRLLWFKLVPDKLAVSMTVRDEQGKPLVRLVDNEWQAVSRFPFDRNYNNNSLEVLDDKHDVVLQVTVLPREIRLQGKWYRSNGDRAYLIQSNGIRRPRNYALMTFDSPGHRRPIGLPEFTIRPMFKYPSDLHPHELETDR